MEKKEIRALVRGRKKELTESLRANKSQRVAARVTQYLSELPPSKVALFLSMPDEVDTSYLIAMLHAQGKHTILVPRVEDEVTIRFYKLKEVDNYEVSNFGILEPTDDVSQAEVPEVMIVPGVAFDIQGGRVGRGRGYYDRYFELHKATIKAKIAIGYHLQVMDEPVPMEPFDERMDALITEEGVYKF